MMVNYGEVTQTNHEFSLKQGKEEAAYTSTTRKIKVNLYLVTFVYVYVYIYM